MRKNSVLTALPIIQIQFLFEYNNNNKLLMLFLIVGYIKRWFFFK